MPPTTVGSWFRPPRSTTRPVAVPVPNATRSRVDKSLIVRNIGIEVWRVRIALRLEIAFGGLDKHW